MKTFQEWYRAQRFSERSCFEAWNASANEIIEWLRSPDSKYLRNHTEICDFIADEIEKRKQKL